MDMEHEIPKTFGVLAAHRHGGPPKTLNAHYVKDMQYFNNPEKTPFNYVMGDTLDQREYFKDYCLTQKGKLLWDQIHMLHWYARELCTTKKRHIRDILGRMNFFSVIHMTLL